MAASTSFARPVVVELGRAGNYRHITGARDAAECLVTAWPLSRGPRHRNAVLTCLKVLEGQRPSEDARRAFVEAAMEAEVPIAASSCSEEQ
ncbi:hypothetical protein ASC75_17100 [Aminobacter sp. DSM 101952]|uniref:DUF982 domain-containing protein n=1 Tax=Aminobacter sp. DSM 101952 TaxID=2735891 RepID=UPI0006FA78A8|nr:DUF982 domain-containing protein [Aminobacter sp. DSM 101952]KQU75749.1 hypothetical protein ASC75_17100 [Aminobacter sp. DSM 101952]